MMVKLDCGSFLTRFHYFLISYDGISLYSLKLFYKDIELIMNIISYVVLIIIIFLFKHRFKMGILELKYV